MAQELVKEVSLYSQNGKAVKQFDASKAKSYFQSSKSVVLDVHDLAKDTYFLYVQLGDKLYENQIMVE